MNSISINSDVEAAGGDRIRQPQTAAELVDVLDTMRAVLGPPEAMASPSSRAIYLLNESRLAATYRRDHT